MIRTVETKEKLEKPPLLYDLTSLQRDANRILGFTAQQTLDFTQSLYEKKLVTYPRTDSGFRYELLTKQFESTIQGQVDRPGWTMNQAREYILDTLNMTRRNRRAVPFEEVKASAKEAAASVLGQLNDLKNRPEPPAKAGKEKAHGGKDTR